MLMTRPKDNRSARPKRGPVSHLEQQIEALAKLPRSRQRVVAAMIDGLLARELDA